MLEFATYFCLGCSRTSAQQALAGKKLVSIANVRSCALRPRVTLRVCQQMNAQARELYALIAARLNGKPFFFDDRCGLLLACMRRCLAQLSLFLCDGCRPSSLDVVVAAHLAIHFHFPGPLNELKVKLFFECEN